VTWSALFGGILGALLMRLFIVAFNHLAHLACVDEQNHAREWFARATARARRHSLPAFRKGMTVVYNPSAHRACMPHLVTVDVQVPHDFLADPALLPVLCTVVCAHAMIGCDEPNSSSCICQSYMLKEVGTRQEHHFVPERAISVPKPYAWPVNHDRNEGQQ